MLFASTALGVLIGAVFVILIVTLRNVRDQQRARGHSEAVIASANHLEQIVLDLETDARRYAITRKGVYLGPLRVASQDLQSVSKQLVALSAGDQTRELRAQRLHDGVLHYAATWASLVIEIAVRDPKKAKELVISSAGLREQDQLRVGVQGVRQHRAGALGCFARARRSHRELRRCARRRRACRVAALDRALRCLREPACGPARAPCRPRYPAACVRAAPGTSRRDRRRRDRRARA